MSRFNTTSHRLTAVDLDIDKRRRKGKGDEDFAGTHHQTIPKYPGIYSTTSKTEIGSIGWNERMNEFEYAKMEAGRGNTHESSTVQRMYFKRHGLGTQGVKYQAKHTFLDLPGSPSRNGGHADLPISSVRPRLNGNRATQSRQPGANHSKPPSSSNSSSARSTPAATTR